MDLLSGIFIIVVLILAVVCVILGLLLVHINGRRQRTPKQKGASAAAGAEPPLTDKAQNPAAVEQGGAAKKHLYDKDKEYFVKLGRTVQDKRKETIILSVGVVSLSIVFLLKLNTGLISDRLLPILCAIIAFLMILVWGLIIKRPKVKVKKKAQPHDFNPVSLGILYFSFALSFWTSNNFDKCVAYTIVAIFFILSAVFFIAVYAKSIRTFVNTYAAPVILSLTTIALISTFLFDLIPAYTHSTGIMLYIILYFGVLWLVNYLLVMYRDVAWEPVRVLVILFFFAAAGIEFNNHNAVGYIGGIALLIIAGLMYCVAVGRIHPYGKLEE